MFRRRRADKTEPDAVVDDVETDLDDETGDQAEAAPAPVDRSNGPYDVTEAPDDGVTRLDLGGLRVAGADGMELRLDVDENTHAVQAVTVVNGTSAVQLTVFAAPRHEGIWDDVRNEIRANLAASGVVDEVDGIFGRELRASLPVTGAQGQSVMQPVRFVGVDGPRWFLRGLFSGPAARDSAVAAPLEAVLRAAVVVRGTDPMAPGDPLPLQVPTEVPEGMSKNEGADRQTLPPPERGPEITEIR